VKREKFRDERIEKGEIPEVEGEKGEIPAVGGE